MADLETIVARMKSRLSSAFNKDPDTTLERVLGTLGNEIAILSGVAADIELAHQVAYATGTNLDRLAAFLGIERTLGETDEDFRARLPTAMVQRRSSGTRADLVDLIERYTGLEEGAGFDFIEPPDATGASPNAAAFLVDWLDPDGELEFNQADLIGQILAAKPGGVAPFFRNRRPFGATLKPGAISSSVTAILNGGTSIPTLKPGAISTISRQALTENKFTNPEFSTLTGWTTAGSGFTWTATLNRAKVTHAGLYSPATTATITQTVDLTTVETITADYYLAYMDGGNHMFRIYVAGSQKFTTTSSYQTKSGTGTADVSGNTGNCAVQFNFWFEGGGETDYPVTNSYVTNPVALGAAT